MFVEIIVGAIVAVGAYFMGRNDGIRAAAEQAYRNDVIASEMEAEAVEAPVETEVVEVIPAVTPAAVEAKPKKVRVVVTVAKVAKAASKKGSSTKKAVKKSK